MESKIGECEQFGHSELEEMARSQKEETWCKSVIRGLARCNREKHAMLAEMEEENQDVVFVDDITGK